MQVTPRMHPKQAPKSLPPPTHLLQLLRPPSLLSQLEPEQRHGLVQALPQGRLLLHSGLRAVVPAGEGR